MRHEQLSFPTPHARTITSPLLSLILFFFLFLPLDLAFLRNYICSFAHKCDPSFPRRWQHTRGLLEHLALIEIANRTDW
ncbi:hypothetical protein BDZ91DRAFT_713961 [Kalaharituber pfeilii]|nr:hypothetical protein BDZ91DRAFT_713961 [Kalaharituber pfeilii]